MKTIVFLTTLIALNLTASSQSTCDSVWVCRDRAIEAAKCLANQELKDSLIDNLQDQVYDLNAAYDALDGYVVDVEKQRDQLKINVQNLTARNEDLERQNKWLKIGVVSVGIGAATFILLSR